MLASSAGRSSRSDVGQPRRIDRREPSRESAERADLRVNRRPAEILEQVVVKVNAVERRVGRMGLMQPREVLVDEVRQGFGGIHSGRIGAPRMAGILYVVATPIGNLEDVTLRALRILREVSLIAAEDTRRTTRLLQHYSISTRTTSLHEHNERGKTPRCSRGCAAGESIALVSDAGTPLISDPGQTLVARGARGRNPRREHSRTERRDGGPVVVGASRPASSSSLDFHQLGQKTASNGSRSWLQSNRGPSVFFEAPHRLRADAGRLVVGHWT